jgi:hypothetical protein
VEVVVVLRRCVERGLLGCPLGMLPGLHRGQDPGVGVRVPLEDQDRDLRAVLASGMLSEPRKCFP